MTQENSESPEMTIGNPQRSIWYIFVITLILGGLQMAWTVEFSEGTPFLLNLGISKQILALVWIAGPLSGTVGQPVVGILSDNSNNSFGRRRPFIIGGCIVICFSLYLISHSVEIMNVFYRSSSTADEALKRATIPLATFGIYLLDFSISAFQAASRAFIVDMIPANQQQLSNAWAARMIGGFNIFGYYLGSVDLTKRLPSFLGKNQFKSLTSCAIIMLLTITLAGCFMIKERDPKSDVFIRNERAKTVAKLKKLGLNENDTSFKNLCYSLYRQTKDSVSRLSPQVRIVNMTEFLAWIGYFPMLFYTTTYVGELYIYEVVTQRQSQGLPDLDEQARIQLTEESTRCGARALLVHSISSLIVNVILPYFVKPSAAMVADSEINVRLLPRNAILRAVTSWKISIQRSWTLAHFVFVLCTFSTFFIKTSTQAIWMFAFLGIPWGSALWAPFVLIGEEITRIKNKKEELTSMRLNTNIVSGSDTDSLIAKPKTLEYEHESGIILGIHNVFVSAPQVISSLFSSFLFKMLSSRFTKDDKFYGKYDDSLAWVFRFGGVMAIGAMIMSTRVKSAADLEREDMLERA